MKNVLISGTSQGLGLATAIALQDSYQVTGFSRKDINNELEVGAKFRHLSGIDIRNFRESNELVESIARADILINNSGIALDGLLSTQAIEDIENIIQINLVSAINLTKVFLREKLKQRRPGVVLNISSIIGVRGYAGLAAYSASKAGLDGLTRSLAREMGPRGFRINSLLPGYFESEMSNSLSNKQRDQITRRTPLGRLANYEDIIPVIKFLIDDDSRFITGQTLIVDGGITV